MVDERLSQALRFNRRLTIEMRVQEVYLPSNSWLNAIVSPEWLSSAHATVLHIGKARDLLVELNNIDPAVSDFRFLQALRMIQVAISQIFSEPVSAVATRLEILERGTNRHLVFALNRSPRLLDIRNCAHGLFIQALTELGITNPQLFEATSPAVDQISPDWLPHVTVAAEPDRAQMSERMSDPVEFLFSPPALRL